MGAVAGGAAVGAGVSAAVGGMGLALGGTAVAIGMAPVAASGAVVGLAAYGLGKLIKPIERPKTTDSSWLDWLD